MRTNTRVACCKIIPPGLCKPMIYGADLLFVRARAQISPYSACLSQCVGGGGNRGFATCMELPSFALFYSAFVLVSMTKVKRRSIHVISEVEI
jgi:hypothetical protein